MCLHCSVLMGYCSDVSNKRRGAAASQTISQETPGRLGVAAPAVPHREMLVRDLVVAGGLRGFSPADLFPERAA